MTFSSVPSLLQERKHSLRIGIGIFVLQITSCQLLLHADSIWELCLFSAADCFRTEEILFVLPTDFFEAIFDCGPFFLCVSFLKTA